MEPFLKSMVVAAGRLVLCNSAPRREQRMQLNVETMEERVVPSTVVGKLALPLTGPALAAPAAETNGEHAVAAPNAVHGYKWRRPRWPYEASNGQTVQANVNDLYINLDGVKGESSVKALGTKMAHPDHPLMVVQDQAPITFVQGHTQMAQGSHLFVGGNEGLTGSASHDGHIVVNVPEGPLPTDFAVSKK
jgi:hypothetical protein